MSATSPGTISAIGPARITAVRSRMLIGRVGTNDV